MQQRVRKANTPNDIAAIPDICPFWYTATLFRPVESTPTIHATIRNKLAQTGQNGPKFCVLCAKKYIGLNKVHHCW